MGVTRRIVLPILVVAFAIGEGTGGRAAPPMVGGISGNVSSSTTLLGLAGSVQIRKVGGTLFGGDLIAGTAILDGSGNYTIDLPPGDYLVLTQNTQGYINEVYDNIPCSTVCNTAPATPITVGGSPVTNIDFVLDPGGRVSGTVTDSGTGLPIANVVVSLYGSNTQVPFTRGVTDVNGNYLSEGGSATGSVFATTGNALGYFNERYDNLNCPSFPSSEPCSPAGGTPISVTSGATTAGINFALAKGGRITGRITDSSGAPLAGIQVFVFSTTELVLLDNLWAVAETDASGNYSTPGLPTSSPLSGYAVYTKNNRGYLDELYDNVACVFNQAAPWFCNPLTGAPVQVTNGATTANINFSLALGGRIAGAITNAQGGAPLAGTVSIYTLGGSLLSPFSGGTSYQTQLLPPGTYFAQATAGGFGTQVYNGIACGGCSPTLGTPITVTADATTGSVNFALSATGSISGTVTNESNGTPLSGVTVQAFGISGQSVGTVATNGSGVYTVSGLTSGVSYYVRTGADGTFINEVYPGLPCPACTVTSSGGTQVAVSAGATTNSIDFALASGGQIRGTVTRAGVGAQSGVPVAVFGSSNLLVGQFNTDGFGVYTTTGLASGTYYVKTSSSELVNELYNDIACPGPGCLPATGTPVSVSSGNLTDNINFVLSAGGQISGSVRSSSGVPLTGASVQLFSSTGRLLGTTGAGPTGSYTLPAVPDGTYFLRASALSGGFVGELYHNQSCAAGCVEVTTGTPVVVTGGANQTGKDFSLDLGGAFIGIVRDANTLAALPSDVTVFSADGTFVRTVSANANGLYTVLSLPAGTYYARTTNTLGYKDEVFNNETFCDPSCDVTDGSPITVTLGGVTNGIDFDLVAGTEMLQNPAFTNGLNNWSLFAQPDNSYLVSLIANGAFHYYRASPPAGDPSSAVILQGSNVAVGSGDPVLVQFDLANTSDARKRVSVLVHDGDFSDLAVCTFWLGPNTTARRYGMLTHPTEAWTNATVSFYAASVDSLGGFYQLDNVTMQTVAGVDIDETQCIDPLLPVSGGGFVGPELLVNGNFSNGTNGWTTLFQITSQVVGGVFEFFRPSPNSDPAGLIFQPTGVSAVAGERFTAHMQLGNSSGVRKRVSVLLHDLDFSDLTVCTFWIDPGQPLALYTMQGYATKAWSNTTLSIYAASPGNEQWIRLDNVSLRKTPAAETTGTSCFEPGSEQPGAAPGGDAGSSSLTSGAASTSVSSAASGAEVETSIQTLEATSGRIATMPVTLDLTQVAGGTLSFESRLSRGRSPAHVEISLDGGEWQTLAAVPASDDWLKLTFDLSPYGGHALRVRFLLDAEAGEPADAKRWQIRNIVLIPGVLLRR